VLGEYSYERNEKEMNFKVVIKENSDKFCKYCGDPIVDRMDYAIYCCSDCQKKAEREKFLKRNPKNNITNGGIQGCRNELRACSDLLEKGFEIFLNPSQAGSCDIVALKDRELFRVEVACAHYSGNGNVGCDPHNPDNYDILAAVTFDKVFYKDGTGKEIDITEKQEEEEKKEKLEKGKYLDKGSYI